MGWKDRGNEMFKIKKYDMAIECYTLSIQFAPSDGVLLGILYSNRSQSYLEKNQYKKAKDDAEKCMKYRPDWLKVSHLTIFLIVVVQPMNNKGHLSSCHYIT